MLGWGIHHYQAFFILPQPKVSAKAGITGSHFNAE
jgi:hypothetical protein